MPEPKIPREVSARLDEPEMRELVELARADDRPPSSMAKILLREALAARRKRATPRTRRGVSPADIP